MRRLSRIEPSARNAYALAHESDCARPRQDAGCHVNNAVVGNCFVCIREDEHAVWERFGAYQDELEPGFNCLGFDVCGLVLTTRRVSARVHENVTRCDSKTKDNVFCSVDVAVQLQPKKGSIFQAVYVLASVNRQVDSYVEDLVRAEIPFQTLAGVFAAKDRIATAVHNRLTRTMGLFGWEILNTLVVNVDVPNPGVKAAYNGVMVAQQMKMATEVTAEATKFVTITRAQAERTSDQLQGEGIAKARAHITSGLQTSVGARSPLEVSELLLMTQYFDTMEHLAHARGNVVFIPQAPRRFKTSCARPVRRVAAATPYPKHSNVDAGKGGSKSPADMLAAAAAANPSNKPDTGAVKTLANGTVVFGEEHTAQGDVSCGPAHEGVVTDV